MLNKLFSGVVIGIDGILIDVEVDVSPRGLPNFTIVGLPNKAVEEAKERVRTAIKNSSFDFPSSRITVNLAPANIPKEGSGFDLPIAVGILAGSGIINPSYFSDSLFLGELSLNGAIKPVYGALPIVEMSHIKKFNKIFLSIDNVYEASLIKGIEIYGIKNLEQLVFYLNNQIKLAPYQHIKKNIVSITSSQYDFAYIKGQYQSKRAFEIAAAGFHNLRLKGQPGSGKTMLSRSFSSILPPMTEKEMIEVARIYSAAGLTDDDKFITQRPFRSPHQTISRIGLIGGGSHPRPGEISLAHRGVLFLDEISEFSHSVIESLRQPLEDGFIWISRASGRLKFPSRFMLIIVSNPCPCGYLGHPIKACNCSQGAILRYKKRLSGPFLDRIDLHVDVAPVENDSLINSDISESSEDIKIRVINARIMQQKRFIHSSIETNGEMGVKEIKRHCLLSESCKNLLKKAVINFSLSARAYFKLIKVAQTIADLDFSEEIKEKHIAEALQFRDRED